MPRTPATEPLPLDAVTLKAALWDTLQQVQSGAMAAGNADSIASQAREILRTAKTQLAICSQARIRVPKELIRFATEDK